MALEDLLRIKLALGQQERETDPWSVAIQGVGQLGQVVGKVGGQWQIQKQQEEFSNELKSIVETKKTPIAIANEIINIRQKYPLITDFVNQTTKQFMDMANLEMVKGREEREKTIFEKEWLGEPAVAGKSEISYPTLEKVEPEKGVLGLAGFKTGKEVIQEAIPEIPAVPSLREREMRAKEKGVETKAEQLGITSKRGMTAVTKGSQLDIDLQNAGYSGEVGKSSTGEEIVYYPSYAPRLQTTQKNIIDRMSKQYDNFNTTKALQLYPTIKDELSEQEIYPDNPNWEEYLEEALVNKMGIIKRVAVGEKKQPKIKKYKYSATGKKGEKIYSDDKITWYNEKNNIVK